MYAIRQLTVCVRVLVSGVWNAPFCVYVFQVQCCFTSTETIRTVRDGEPNPATSNFIQLLSSESTSLTILHLYLKLPPWHLSSQSSVVFFWVDDG